MDKQDFEKMYCFEYKNQVNHFDPENAHETDLKDLYLRLTAIFGEQLNGKLEADDYRRLSLLLNDLLHKMKLR